MMTGLDSSIRSRAWLGRPPVAAGEEADLRVEASDLAGGDGLVGQDGVGEGEQGVDRVGGGEALPAVGDAPGFAGDQAEAGEVVAGGCSLAAHELEVGGGAVAVVRAVSMRGRGGDDINGRGRWAAISSPVRMLVIFPVTKVRARSRDRSALLAGRC